MKFTPLDLAIYPLAALMGCPCCGPEWYRALLRFSDRLADREPYPEYALSPEKGKES